MKKVLLATTILGMTAGFAAAEVALTGEATAGLASVNGGDFDNYTSFELSVAATGESDSGVSFGASFSATNGAVFDFDGACSSISGVTVDTGDCDDDGDVTEFVEGDKSGAFGNPTVFISGGFGKVTFGDNEFDNYSNDDKGDNDVEYTHSISGLDIGLRADIDDGSMSASLGYTVGGVKLGALFDEDGDDYKISASYTMGAITAGIAMDEADVTTLNLDYAANGMSAGLEIDSEEAYTLSVGYSANGMSVNAEIDDASVWEITGGYDLGGGLTLEAGIHESESAYLGAKMSF